MNRSDSPPRLSGTAKTALGKIISWLGLDERRCAACRSPFRGGLGNALSERICPICQNLLHAYDGPRCSKCGVPSLERVCSKCVKNPPPWAGLAYHGLYGDMLRDLILRIKFSADLSLVPLLADFLIQACCKLPRPDFLVPIPQYPAGLRKRGFNQAHELAKQVAKTGGLSATCGLLKRVKAGPPQESLTAQEREENMRGAFLASPQVKGHTLWLIDDVMTTGSTCRSASEELLRAGAKKVYLLVVARTPL